MIYKKSIQYKTIINSMLFITNCIEKNNCKKCKKMLKNHNNNLKNKEF